MLLTVFVSQSYFFKGLIADLGPIGDHVRHQADGQFAFLPERGEHGRSHPQAPR